MELARGESTGLSRPVGKASDQVEPCVLRSSWQCGDQWREVTEVFRAMVWIGEGGEMVEVALQMRIMPSGKMLPVASRSGFHGHHAKA